MARTSRALAFAVLALVCATQTGAAPETYQIALKFRAGQMLRYEINQTVQMDLQLPGQPVIKVQVTNQGILRERVLSVSPDGAAELLNEFESWNVSVWANGKEQPPTQDVQALLSTSLRTRVTPLGRVELLEPKTLPEGVDLDTLADYSFVPSAAVAVGQAWSGDEAREVSGILCQTKLTNRLERVDVLANGRVAQIGQDLHLTIPDSPVPIAGGINGQVTASGTILGVSSLSFNLDSGVVQKQMSIVNGKVLAKLQTGEAKLDMPMVIDVTTVITLLS